MQKLLKWLCTLPILRKLFTPESLAQFIRYIFVGVFCFSIEYILFIVLRNELSVSEILVNILVYTIIFWLNFLLNKFFSFRSTVNFKRQLFLYGSLFFFNLIVGNIFFSQNSLYFGSHKRRRVLACFISSENFNHVFYYFMEFYPV